MLEQFLQEYTKLEENIRRIHTKSVLDYENGLQNPDEKEKLKICRLIRNYVRHNSDGAEFLEATKPMCSFIAGINKEFERMYDHVSDKCKKVKPITEDMTLTDVAGVLNKYPYIPFVDKDKNIVGVFDKDLLTYYIAQGVKPSVKLKPLLKDEKLIQSKSQYYFAKGEDRLSLYHPKNKIIVIDSNDKYKGVIYW